MKVEIRDALDGDAEASAPLMEQLMHRPCTPEQIRSRLRRLASTGVDRVMVAVLDGRVVGVAGVTYAWLFHLDVPTARLMSIVVDESCRGQGIGRRLVEASIEQARAWGCDRLELTSRLERSDAHSFYETVGFAQTSKKFQMPIQASEREGPR
jgi:GNAT superfamily N-acetyltransferase